MLRSKLDWLFYNTFNKLSDTTFVNHITNGFNLLNHNVFYPSHLYGGN